MAEDPSRAPVVFVKAGEAVLADRAIAGMRAQARQNDPNTEFIRIFADQYHAGQLAVEMSPSLFGEAKMIEIADFDKAGGELSDDISAAVANPQPDVRLIIRRNGGNKGSGLLKKKGVAVLDFPVIKKQSDKLDLVRREFSGRRRRASVEAVQTLVEALGDNLAELLAAANQLMDDVEGEIDTQVVLDYFGDRYVANGFAVADALIGGNVSGALELLRFSREAGNNNSAIIGALAYRFRQFIAVLDSRGQLAHEQKMQPWQAQKVRSDLRGWSPEGIAFAFEVLATADAAVKGASVSPDYVLERAVQDIARHRRD